MSELSNPAPRRKFLDYLIGLLIFSAVILESLHTIHQIGVSWDEPAYFGLVKSYAQWFQHLGAGSFRPATLENTFGIRLFGNAHPSLAKLLGVISYLSLKNVLGGFWAFRFYAPVCFGLLMSLIYLRAASAWGRTAGAASVVCAFFMPRLFTEGHLAATEAPLMFFWFLTMVTFERSFRRRAFAPIAGVCLGLAMSVKFTAFTLPIPLLLWALIYHRKQFWYSALCLVLIAPFVFFFLQPAMWHSPAAGLMDFIDLSITRKGKTLIPVYFLGKGYNFRAPWYYAPFMVMVTVPAVTLVLFLLGLVRSALLRLKDPLATMSILTLGFLLVAMMSPSVPTYDGVRLFITAFVFLALLAGFGFDGLCGWIVARLGKRPPGSRARLMAAKVAALIIFGLAVIVPFEKNYPYGLEYYNELIGGPSGAKRRGMETTYWWTVLNEAALARLNAILPANASVLFYPTTASMGEFYQELGLLRKDLAVNNKKYADYFLVLSRPYYDFDRIFNEHLGTPRAELQVVAEQDLDGVPLWVLYKNLHTRY